jgi:thymidylate synthase
MKPYMDVVDRVMAEGVWKTNRTKFKALTIAGASATYEVSRRFPMLTLKKVPPKSMFGELVGFLKGVQSAAVMRELGSKIWDQNANENEDWLANPFRLGEDDLGPVYGSQWRRWPAYKRVSRSHQNHAKIHTKLKREGWNIVSSFAQGNDIIDLWFKEVDQLFECYEKIKKNPFIANKQTQTLDLCMLQR